MTDDTETTTTTSRPLFGLRSPGRVIALTIGIGPILLLVLAAWWGGAL